MRSRHVLVAFALAVAALEAPEPGRASPPESLRPSPAMARLYRAFLGEWIVHESFEVGGSERGATRDGTATFREGAGFSLVEDYRSDGTAGELRFLALFWWDPGAGAYPLMTCANSRGCAMRGTARWEGDTLVNAWDVVEGGKKVSHRDSFIDISPGSFRLVSEGVSEGKTEWRVMTRYTRRDGARGGQKK